MSMSGGTPVSGGSLAPSPGAGGGKDKAGSVRAISD